MLRGLGMDKNLTFHLKWHFGEFRVVFLSLPSPEKVFFSVQSDDLVKSEVQ